MKLRDRFNTDSPTESEKKLSDNDVQLQIAKVIISLRLLIELNQPDLLQNLHLVKMGELVKIIPKRSWAQAQLCLQIASQKYINPFYSTQKLQEHRHQFTRLKNLVRADEDHLFKKKNLTDDEKTFDTLTTHLSIIFSFLEKILPEDKMVITDKATEQEKSNLLNFYYYPQILREHRYQDVLDYQQQDTMFEQLDRAIFAMMQQNQADLVEKLLRHRILLVAYILENRKNIEKIKLAQTLSHETAKVIHATIITPESKTAMTGATEINQAANNYYAACVTSNTALSADSLGKKIIKSTTAIAVGVLFCALVLLVAWLISYYWCGIALAALSWKIQAGIVSTASCLLLISGFFSHRWLRGQGCLDSEISQNIKAITQDVRKIGQSLPT